MVCLGVVLIVLVLCWPEQRRLYDGMPIEHLEKRIRKLVGSGGFEAEVVGIIQKIGPDSTPFWLARLQYRDSQLARIYLRVWLALPVRLKSTFPEPISQRERRNLASYVLSKLNTTNGIPELIALSYSSDSEIQEHAVQLLWSRANQFYRPSEECIAAFCAALKSPNVRARHWAVLGLGILPLHEEALPALEEARHDSDPSVRTKAEEIIREMRKHNPVRMKHG